jgi:hypothetical protein
MSQTYLLDKEDPLKLQYEVPADIFTPLTPTQVELNREISWQQTSGYIDKTPIS